MEFNEAAPKYYPKMSPSDFLEWEGRQEYKHEYAAGEIFATAGASLNHSKISSNIIGRTWNHLQGKGSSIFRGDLRIAVNQKTLFLSRRYHCLRRARV